MSQLWQSLPGLVSAGVSTFDAAVHIKDTALNTAGQQTDGCSHDAELSDRHARNGHLDIPLKVS